MLTLDLKDHRGHEITPGDLVAYNFGGEIAIGVVKLITVVKRNGKERPSFKVEQKIPTPGTKSVVSSAKNMLVINEILIP